MFFGQCRLDLWGFAKWVPPVRAGVSIYVCIYTHMYIYIYIEGVSCMVYSDFSREAPMCQDHDPTLGGPGELSQ